MMQTTLEVEDVDHHTVELFARIELLTIAGALAPLTLADGCDGCSRRASVRAVMSMDETSGHVQDLLFCGVHWTEHSTGVLDRALLFQDERELQARSD